MQVLVLDQAKKRFRKLPLSSGKLKESSVRNDTGLIAPGCQWNYDIEHGIVAFSPKVFTGADDTSSFLRGWGLAGTGLHAQRARLEYLFDARVLNRAEFRQS
jgi:hypothetical protein